MTVYIDVELLISIISSFFAVLLLLYPIRKMVKIVNRS